jgi:hypothetical protein
MTYCHKCGAKLDENARFCRVCGTPVEQIASAQGPYRARTQRHSLWPVAVVLIAVLVVAFFVAVLTVLPVQSVNFSQSNDVAKIPGVNTINLNLEADVADVNVILTDLPNQFARIDVSAAGSVGVAGNVAHPVQVTFTNETVGSEMTITSRISRDGWPFSFNLKVVCDVYIDRSEVLNINAGTTVGRIIMNTIGAATFQRINLHNTTGSVAASLNNRVALSGDVTVSATTGSVSFDWDNVAVSREISVNVESTTGAVSTQISQNKALSGNVSLNTRTTTGSVDLSMTIAGNVGAMITSHTSLGSISNEVQSFNGNKSPIYSNNYPATSNFLCNLETTTGSIHINAAYNGIGSGSNA